MLNKLVLERQKYELEKGTVFDGFRNSDVTGRCNLYLCYVNNICIY